jgi:phospholipase/carboxylesterase
MPYTTHESEESVVLEPAATADAAVIWLHGLGADGYDFVPIVNELRLPPAMAVRFIFPHARPRPVTINNGFVMRAWYDITGLGPDRKEDDAGIRESAGVVNGYIEQQNARAVRPSASCSRDSRKGVRLRCRQRCGIPNALRV